MRYILLFLTIGCASWAPTRNAAVRRAEEAWLRSCVQFQCQFTHQCILESARRCQGQGLEATCGSDGAWTETPIRCYQ